MQRHIPEQGQLVEVRNRPFIVTEVSKSNQPVSLLDQRGNQVHHLVTLSAVEDDALGEELQVIWEVEAGTQIYEQATLPTPTGFDPPHRLAAFLNAVRWGAAVAADGRLLQAPFRSGIDIEDYQLDPVVRAIQMPRVNLLIADDVGLGKSIEGGLVMQELIIRGRVQRILIVCPAALQIQWQEQMRDKFGLEFRIVDSALMHDLRRQRGLHVNPWTHFPRLITSIDYLKRDRPMRLFRETLPARGEASYPRRYDLLLVDESHNVAPAGRGHYAIDSQRTDAIRVLAPHFEHRLFLTATPHNGYSESFSALLELLDNQRFARGVPPDPATLAQVMVRRLKTELQDDFGQPRFPGRHLVALGVAYSEEERTVHHHLQTYMALRRQHAKDEAERTATEFVLKLLKKRLFSSPAAFALTLAKHQATMSGQAQDKTMLHSTTRPAAGLLRARLETLEESDSDDSAEREATDNALSMAGRLFTPLTPAEQSLLDAMSAWAQRAQARADSKARHLIAWLTETLRPHGQWNEERVIIFTEYRDTQKWLQELLAAAGLTAHERLLTLHGGMTSQERERVKAAFQTAPTVSPVRILLATDAASEGIDLQRHCHRLLHYEIPWNPNRLEQRNGRIDRHGQAHQPQIYHFAPAGFTPGATGPRLTPGELEWDLEFLMLAVNKVEQIRADLGKVGPVIAEQVTEAMVGQRDRLQTLDAERAAEPVRRLLKFERNLEERIRKLHDQLLASKRELNLAPENIQAVVEIALALAGQPPLQPVALPGIWPDPSGRSLPCPVFQVPALHGVTWARCTEGLEHPHTHVRRPIVFDHNLARGRDDVVLAHLNHRLVQLSLRLLRAQVWSNRSGSGLHRVTACVAPDHRVSDLAVIAHARLVSSGGDSRRLHEEIIQAGGEVRQGSFRRFDTLQRMNEIWHAATDRLPAEPILGKLRTLWPTIAATLQQALDLRGQERTTSLQRVLAQRAAKEAADMQSILNELAQAIRAELREEPLQLSLFNIDERQQYSRNVAALEARLAQIPAEIAQEQAVIARRYAEPQARLFPVAVTFVVPERLAR
ncbi:MAG: DISARM system SNF2-like helicase DrmD [Caldilineaceae bacterium]